MNARLTLTLALTAALTTASSAQILLPPPPPKPDQPVYEPPAAAPVAPRRPTRTNEAAQRRATERTLNRNTAAPNVPYRLPSRPIEIPSTEAYDGPALRYEEPMEIVSVRFNPLINQEIAARLTAVLAERRVELEPMVIEHLDAMVNIRGGMIEASTIQDMPGMKAVTDAIEPLRIREPMLDIAVQREILTRRTRTLHDQIIREYQQVLSAEVAEENPNGTTDFWFQFVLRDGVREAELAYVDMLAEAATRMPAVRKAAGISDGDAGSLDAIKADRATLDADMDARRDIANRVELAMRPLTIEQRKALLRGVIDTRGEGAPLLPILRTDRPDPTPEEIAAVTTPANANATDGD
jgi:hypothetical protein